MINKIIVSIGLLAAASLAFGQAQPGDVVPASSVIITQPPIPPLTTMHTNYFIHATGGVIKATATPAGETPASLACIYDLVSTPITGCPIATAREVPTGGSGVIVIVEAFDYPSAAADLKTFSTEFGLPAPNFAVKYATGIKPVNGCTLGWSGEEALAIEWAHAMAPNAQIVLMEAASNTDVALYEAVTEANSYIAAHGGKGEVSMSWGGSETSTEASSDHYFEQPNVVYFASTNAFLGVSYPSSSVNVISAGGTQVNRNGANYTNQTAWSDGGGVSLYESKPLFQDNVSGIVGAHRSTPDLSFSSSGISPVAVYNSSCYGGWLQLYGTSLSAPALAGIINSAGTFHASSIAENTEIYANRAITSDFTDITSGSCGTNSATAGYDVCTGVGVDKGFHGK